MYVCMCVYVCIESWGMRLHLCVHARAHTQAQTSRQTKNTSYHKYGSPHPHEISTYAHTHTHLQIGDDNEISTVPDVVQPIQNVTISGSTNYKCVGGVNAGGRYMKVCVYTCI